MQALILRNGDQVKQNAIEHKTDGVRRDIDDILLANRANEVKQKAKPNHQNHRNRRQVRARTVEASNHARQCRALQHDNASPTERVIHTFKVCEKLFHFVFLCGRVALTSYLYEKPPKNTNHKNVITWWLDTIRRTVLKSAPPWCYNITPLSH